MVKNSTGEGEESNVAYDLRQIYARLLGEHLIDAAEARKAGDFYNWFKSLEDVKTVSQHNFKNKVQALKDYEELIKNVICTANKCPSAWSGQNKEAVEIGLIEKTLRELEEFLYTQLKDGGVLGSTWDGDGL